MKKKLLAIGSAVAAVVTGAILIATMASGADQFTTSPYPSVSSNPNVCLAEKAALDAAQSSYNAANNAYQSELNLFNRGYSSPQAVDDKRKALDTAAIALNNAKYAYATCQNNNSTNQNKNCTNLNLELNRLMDELALRQDLEAIAKRSMDRIYQLYTRGYATYQEYLNAKAAYDQAHADTVGVQQKINDQKTKITNAGCTPDPRPSASPSPSSPSPTGTPTPTPTSSH